MARVKKAARIKKDPSYITESEAKLLLSLLSTQPQALKQQRRVMAESLAKRGLCIVQRTRENIWVTITDEGRQTIHRYQNTSA